MFVYAVYNRENKKLYIGQTNDISRRVFEHNQKLGNHFTAMFQGEWVLIYKESVATRSEALSRENSSNRIKDATIYQNIFRGSSAVERVAVNH